MSIQRTLSIIKPDGVEKNLIGEIYSRFENGGLRIIAARMMRLTREQAGRFYAVHEERPFFERLVTFMASGPIMVQILEGESAISKNRELMGATNPRKAEPGSIRRDFAADIPEQELHRNIVHGSDSPDNAELEIRFFFKPEEICARST